MFVVLGSCRVFRGHSRSFKHLEGAEKGLFLAKKGARPDATGRYHMVSMTLGRKKKVIKVIPKLSHPFPNKTQYINS